MFTRARHLSVFSARSILSTRFQIISLRSIVLLCSLLHVDLPSGLFLSDYPTKPPSAPLPSPICVICPVNFILLFLITRIMYCEGCKPWTSAGILCSFLESSLTSFFLFINPFSKSLSLSSFLSVVDQVSHPYRVPFTVGYWARNILYVWSSP